MKQTRSARRRGTWSSTEDDLLKQIVRQVESRGVTVIRTLSIPRNAIDKSSLEPTLATLQGMVKDKASALSNMRKLHVQVLGYDDDPRELFEIPEVRSFLAALDSHFPHWFLLLAPDAEFLPLLMLSLYEPAKAKEERDGKFRAYLTGGDLSAFLQRHVAALLDIVEDFSLDDDDFTSCQRIMEDVTRQLNIPWSL